MAFTIIDPQIFDNFDGGDFESALNPAHFDKQDSNAPISDPTFSTKNADNRKRCFVQLSL